MNILKKMEKRKGKVMEKRNDVLYILTKAPLKEFIAHLSVLSIIMENKESEKDIVECIKEWLKGKDSVWNAQLKELVKLHQGRVGDQTSLKWFEKAKSWCVSKRFDAKGLKVPIAIARLYL